MFENFLFIVGEKDEVSIREVALLITEAMEFKGEVIVSCLCKMIICILMCAITGVKCHYVACYKIIDHTRTMSYLHT